MTKSVLVARLVLWAASKSLSWWLCSAIIITDRNQRASVSNGTDWQHRIPSDKIKSNSPHRQLPIEGTNKEIGPVVRK